MGGRNFIVDSRLVRWIELAYTAGVRSYSLVNPRLGDSNLAWSKSVD